MKRFSTYLPLSIFALMQLAAVGALILFQSPEIATIIGMAGLGVVVQGQEIDKITDLDLLHDMRKKSVKAIGEFRDKHKANGDKWEDDAQRSAYESANTDYDELGKRIDELRDSRAVGERWDAIEAEQNRMDEQNRGNGGGGNAGGLPEVNENTRAMAFQGWANRQAGHDMTEAQQMACRAVGVNPNARNLNVRLMSTDDYRRIQETFRNGHPAGAQERLNNQAFENRALTTTTGSSGGDLIPPVTFIRNLEIALLQFGGIRQVADVIRTATGEQIKWPTANDSGNKGRRIGESTASNTNVDPAFGNVTWGAHKYTSDAILTPYELLQDSAFNMMQILGSMCGERIGRKEAEDTTTGTGTGEPNGVVTASALGVTAAGIALVSDDIINLEHSVDPAYRGDASYMMHDNIVLAVRLLKDNEGRYLWRSGLLDGRPDQLNGRRLVINQEMADTIATAAKIMTFGQHSKYKIRDVGVLRLHHLVERYRVEADQDAFVAIHSVEGNLLQAGTTANCPVKHLLLP